MTSYRARLALSLLLTAVPTLVQAQQSNTSAATTTARKQSGGAAQVQQGATGADWPSHGGTQLSWRFSALNQISNTNVKKMVPVWAFQTGDYSDGLETTPIAIDGVVYISTAYSNVFALDGATGKLIWQYKYQASQQTTGGGLKNNRGVAVAGGKVFVGGRDGYLVALDQKTGRELWKVNAGGNISAAPLVVKDKVIVGGRASRGHVSAYNMETGRLAWRFYAVPGAGEKGNETWEGDSWKYGGGYPWTTGSYDPELNLVYWGTGDASPPFNGTHRQGIDLYGNCVLALDADTGALRWYYQEIPHDTWDYDATWEMVLMDREVRGKMRKLLVQASKSGFTFILDRETGEVLGTYPYVENINWVKSITQTGELVGRHDVLEEEPPWNVCPSNLGGKSWNEVAYSPGTGLMYVPALELCNHILLRQARGSDHGGGTWVFKEPPGHDSAYSHLDAIDPVTGKKQWSYPYKFELFASILATAGDLVLTGDPEGYFFALDARTGKKLWNFQTGAPNRGSPVTYMAGGRQYIATPSGWTVVGDMTRGVWPETETWRVASTLTVFGLPEESK